MPHILGVKWPANKITNHLSPHRCDCDKESQESQLILVEWAVVSVFLQPDWLIVGSVQRYKSPPARQTTGSNCGMLGRKPYEFHLSKT